MLWIEKEDKNKTKENFELKHVCECNCGKIKIIFIYTVIRKYIEL